MAKTITFNELRKIKDSLPHGTIQKIADELGLDADVVRHYFGGDHVEVGPDGGIIKLDDTTILDAALKYIDNEKN